MAVRLLVPWFGFKPGDVVDRGEPLEQKLLKEKKGERVTIISDTAGKATTRPKGKA